MLVATITRKYKNEIYGIVEGFGVMLIDCDHISGPIKVGMKLDGIKAGGSFIAKNRIEQ